MAIGDVVLKKVSQGQLSTTNNVALYTVPTGKQLQVCEIWLASYGTTDRKIGITVGGTYPTGLILNGLVIPAGGSANLTDLKIVMNAGESIYAFEDAGNDVVLTIYGIEEQIA